MVDVNHARRIRSHGCTSGEQAGHDRSRKGSVFRHDLTPSNVPRSAVDKRLIINPPDLSMGDWLIIKLPKNSNVVPHKSSFQKVFSGCAGTRGERNTCPQLDNHK
jgi:hypothetical protein